LVIRLGAARAAVAAQAVMAALVNFMAVADVSNDAETIAAKECSR